MAYDRLQSSLTVLTAGAPPAHRWGIRSLVGLLALETAVAALILLAGNPPVSPARYYVDLGPSTVPPPLDMTRLAGVPKDPRPYAVALIGPPDLPDLGLADEQYPVPPVRSVERQIAMAGKLTTEPPASSYRPIDRLESSTGIARMQEVPPVAVLPPERAMSAASGLSEPQGMVPAPPVVVDRQVFRQVLPDEPRPFTISAPDVLPASLPAAEVPSEALREMDETLPPVRGLADMVDIGIPPTVVVEMQPKTGPGIPDEERRHSVVVAESLPPAPIRVAEVRKPQPVPLLERLEPRGGAPLVEFLPPPSVPSADTLSSTKPFILTELAQPLFRQPESLQRHIDMQEPVQAALQSAETDKLLVSRPLIEVPSLAAPDAFVEAMLPQVAGVLPLTEGLSLRHQTSPVDVQLMHYRLMMVPEQTQLSGGASENEAAVSFKSTSELPAPLPILRQEALPPFPSLRLMEVASRPSPLSPAEDVLHIPLARFGDDKLLYRELVETEKLPSRRDQRPVLRDTPVPRPVPDPLVVLAGLRLQEPPRPVERVTDISLRGFEPLRIFDVAPDGSGAVARRPAALVPHGMVRDAGRLQSVLRDLDYAGGSVLSVPGFFIHRLPTDMARIEEPESKKRLFLRSILPHILHANERMLYLRRRAIELAGQVDMGNLSADEKTEIEGILAEVALERWDFLELMRRLDSVPPSLALAQAAEETGWGTSDMAISGNALFGQVHWVRENGRVVRQQRPFNDLYEGVMAYVRNLNTHSAYAGFRARRAQMRLRGQVPNGLVLINELDKYSERGGGYQDNIRALITRNNLLVYDRARFRSGAGVAEAEGE